MKRLMIAVLLCISSPNWVAAYVTESGNDFLKKCDGDLDDIDLAYCLGKTVGVWDGIVAMVMSVARNSQAAGADVTVTRMRELFFFTCIDSNNDWQQLMDVAIDYMHDNPAVRHYPVGELMRRAWVEAFPCKE